MGRPASLCLLAVLVATLLGRLGTAEEDDIHTAVTGGDLEKVKQLLAKKPGLAKAADAHGQTPLHLVALTRRCGSGVMMERKEAVAAREAITELLFEAAADPNTKDQDGLMPLHYALENSQYLGIAKILVRHGADVTARGRRGETPLHVAAMLGNRELGALLIAKGAEVSGLNDEGESPLDVALKFSGSDSTLRIPFVDLLLANGVPLEIWVAAGTGKEDVIEKMVRADAALLNAKDKRGRTPLYMAVYCGQAKAAAQLLGMGADANIQDQDGFSPLHLAQQSASDELTQLLLSHGANVNARTKDGWTPLLYACFYNGKISRIEMLLKQGADVKVQNRHGETPLHIAASKGALEAVRMFMSNGADVNGAMMNGGLTPLHLAALYGHKTVAELLVAQGADTKGQAGTITPLHCAAEGGNVEVAKLLVKNGASVKATQIYRQTPLHAAVVFGKKEMAEYLIESGSDVNAKGNDGSALHVAAARGRVEMVVLLLNHGANVNLVNDAGKTPLDVTQPGRAGILELLRQHGGKSAKEQQ